MTKGSTEEHPAAGCLGCLFGAVALALALSGCATNVKDAYVYGYAVEATGIPVTIATYPRVTYRGTDTYLVNGRWYFPTTRGWAVYLEEPPELAQSRVEYYSRKTPPPARTPQPPEIGYPPDPPPVPAQWP